jgi:hypothetical protein
MSNAEKPSTGRVIARSLIRDGVDTNFGIPAAHTCDFIDALYECRDKIRFIVNRHEQGSGYMAYGYAKPTYRMRPVAIETPWAVFGAEALVDLDVPTLFRLRPRPIRTRSRATSICCARRKIR